MTDEFAVAQRLYDRINILLNEELAAMGAENRVDRRQIMVALLTAVHGELDLPSAKPLQKTFPQFAFLRYATMHMLRLMKSSMEIL